MLALLRVGPGDDTAGPSESAGPEGPAGPVPDGSALDGAGVGAGAGAGAALRGAAGATGTFAPAPDLGGLAELADRIGVAGVPVRLRTEGAVRRLPAGVGLCAYRVVQEALTNVLKYARPCRADVLVDYGRDTLLIRVTDDGPGRVPAQRGSSGGHGLTGMRERARILGGTVTAGPRPEGGFEVELVLPVPPPGGDPDGRCD